MSHWKQFKSNALVNTKKPLLAKALEEMGLTLDENIKSIRNTWGNDSVDAGLRRNGQQLSLGFKFKNVDGEEQLELSGDFYGTGVSEYGFIDKLSQVYQKNNIIECCEDQGYTVDEVTELEDGRIRVEVSQYA